MKRTMKILALSLCLVMMVSVLAACGDVSGEYSYTDPILNSVTTYEFSTFGNDVVKTYKLGNTTTTQNLTYELNKKGDEITFYNEDGDKVESRSFSKGDNYIKMGLLTYTKA